MKFNNLVVSCLLLLSVSGHAGELKDSCIYASANQDFSDVLEKWSLEVEKTGTADENGKIYNKLLIENGKMPVIQKIDELLAAKGYQKKEVKSDKDTHDVYSLSTI